MAGARKSSGLQTATQRAKRAARHQPYWSNVAEGVALGYRRGPNGGAWYCRVYEGKGHYKQFDLGSADDHLEADGKAVLTYFQASEQGRLKAAEYRRARRIGSDLDVTVRNASERYLKWFEQHKKAYAETKASVDAHILPKLGDIKLVELTSEKLRDWHRALAAKGPRRRTRPGKAQVYGAKPVTEDEKRARRASANRVLTIAKAILNHAFEQRLVADNAEWRRVKPFKGTDEPIIRFLEPAESTRLLNAAPLPFRNLLAAALHTGARYSELANMQAADFKARDAIVYIRPGKSGKARNVPLSAEGLKFFERAVAGKSGDTLLFTRADGHAWSKSYQIRPLAEACAKAKIAPAITFHTLRHCYGSALARAGVPLLTISKLLGHADTRITSRHYAHLADKELQNAVALLPMLNMEMDRKIVAIR